MVLYDGIRPLVPPSPSQDFRVMMQTRKYLGAFVTSRLDDSLLSGCPSDSINSDRNQQKGSNLSGFSFSSPASSEI